MAWKSWHGNMAWKHGARDWASPAEIFQPLAETLLCRVLAQPRITAGNPPPPFCAGGGLAAAHITPVRWGGGVKQQSCPLRCHSAGFFVASHPSARRPIRMHTRRGEKPGWHRAALYRRGDDERVLLPTARGGEVARSLRSASHSCAGDAPVGGGGGGGGVQGPLGWCSGRARAARACTSHPKHGMKT